MGETEQKEITNGNDVSLESFEQRKNKPAYLRCIDAISTSESWQQLNTASRYCAFARRVGLLDGLSERLIFTAHERACKRLSQKSMGVNDDFAGKLESTLSLVDGVMP